MKNKLKGFILFCGAILSACGNQDKLPGDIMPPEKMQAVLWDMMRADQFISDYVVSRDTTRNRDKESIRLYSQIFLLHHITREEFNKSFAYYRTHPTRLQPVMDSMSRQSLAAPTQQIVPDTVKSPDTSHIPQVRPEKIRRTFRGDTTRPFYLKK